MDHTDEVVKWKTAAAALYHGALDRCGTFRTVEDIVAYLLNYEEGRGAGSSWGASRRRHDFYYHPENLPRPLGLGAFFESGVADSCLLCQNIRVRVTGCRFRFDYKQPNHVTPGSVRDMDLRRLEHLAVMHTPYFVMLFAELARSKRYGVHGSERAVREIARSVFDRLKDDESLLGRSSLRFLRLWWRFQDRISSRELKVSIPGFLELRTEAGAWNTRLDPFAARKPEPLYSYLKQSCLCHEIWPGDAISYPNYANLSPRAMAVNDGEVSTVALRVLIPRSHLEDILHSVVRLCEARRGALGVAPAHTACAGLLEPRLGCLVLEDVGHAKAMMMHVVTSLNFGWQPLTSWMRSIRGKDRNPEVTFKVFLGVMGSLRDLCLANKRPARHLYAETAHGEPLLAAGFLVHIRTGEVLSLLPYVSVSRMYRASNIPEDEEAFRVACANLGLRMLYSYLEDEVALPKLRLEGSGDGDPWEVVHVPRKGVRTADGATSPSIVSKICEFCRTGLVDRDKWSELAPQKAGSREMGDGSGSSVWLGRTGRRGLRSKLLGLGFLEPLHVSVIESLNDMEALLLRRTQAGVTMGEPERCRGLTSMLRPEERQPSGIVVSPSSSSSCAERSEARYAQGHKRAYGLQQRALEGTPAKIYQAESEPDYLTHIRELSAEVARDLENSLGTLGKADTQPDGLWHARELGAEVARNQASSPGETEAWPHGRRPPDAEDPEGVATEPANVPRAAYHQHPVFTSLRRRDESARTPVLEPDALRPVRELGKEVVREPASTSGRTEGWPHDGWSSETEDPGGMPTEPADAIRGTYHQHSAFGSLRRGEQSARAPGPEESANPFLTPSPTRMETRGCETHSTGGEATPPAGREAAWDSEDKDYSVQHMLIDCFKDQFKDNPEALHEIVRENMEKEVAETEADETLGRDIMEVIIGEPSEPGPQQEPRDHRSAEPRSRDQSTWPLVPAQRDRPTWPSCQSQLVHPKKKYLSHMLRPQAQEPAEVVVELDKGDPRAGQAAQPFARPETPPEIKWKAPAYRPQGARLDPGRVAQCPGWARDLAIDTDQERNPTVTEEQFLLRNKRWKCTGFNKADLIVGLGVSSYPTMVYEMSASVKALKVRQLTIATTPQDCSAVPTPCEGLSVPPAGSGWNGPWGQPNASELNGATLRNTELSSLSGVERVNPATRDKVLCEPGGMVYERQVDTTAMSSKGGRASYRTVNLGKAPERGFRHVAITVGEYPTLTKEEAKPLLAAKSPHTYYLGAVCTVPHVAGLLLRRVLVANVGLLQDVLDMHTRLQVHPFVARVYTLQLMKTPFRKTAGAGVFLGEAVGEWNLGCAYGIGAMTERDKVTLAHHVVQCLLRAQILALRVLGFALRCVNPARIWRSGAGFRVDFVSCLVDSMHQYPHQDPASWGGVEGLLSVHAAMEQLNLLRFLPRWVHQFLLNVHEGLVVSSSDLEALVSQAWLRQPGVRPTRAPASSKDVDLLYAMYNLCMFAGQPISAESNLRAVLGDGEYGDSALCTTGATVQPYGPFYIQIHHQCFRWNKVVVVEPLLDVPGDLAQVLALTRPERAPRGSDATRRIKGTRLPPGVVGFPPLDSEPLPAPERTSVPPGTIQVLAAQAEVTLPAPERTWVTGPSSGWDRTKSTVPTEAEVPETLRAEPVPGTLCIQDMSEYSMYYHI